MKFKINDKVRVICADKETSTYTTRSMVGEVAKVVKYSGVSGIPYTLYFEDKNYSLNFMEKELEPVAKVGEQLLLFEL